jgi:ankyrin repeat protein
MTDSSARYKNLNHNVIIDLVRAFAANIPEAGVCNGFTSMWLQAYLGGKEKEQDFYNRLDRISDFIIQNHDFKNLKNEIETLYKERSEKLNKIRTEVREKTIFERNYLLPLTKEQENELEKIDKQLRAQFPPFTEDELKKIELRAFAEAVAIQQNPTALGFVGFKTIETNEQNTKAFKEPKSKYQLNQGDKNLLYSMTMDESEKKIDTHLVGIVVTDRDDLNKYFSELAEIIKVEDKLGSLKKQSDTISFLLSSDNHTVGAYFDLKTDRWHFLDINQLSNKETYFFEVTSETLPEEIFTSFFDSDSVNTAFAIQSLSKNVSNQFIEQLKNPSKKRLSDTIGKLNSRDINSLYLAVNHNESQPILDLTQKMLPTDINCIYKGTSYTALMRASAYGHAESVKVLLNNGANLETANIDGITALMDAASHGQTEVLQVLIEAHANLEAVDKYNQTALMRASANGHTESVKVLLNNGANLETANIAGITALMDAASHGHTEVIQELIEAKANLEAVDNLGFTALMLAAANRHTESVKVLSKNHANLETKSMHGITALIHAASHGHTEVLQALVEANANLDAVDNYGFTALMLAAANRHTESVKVLSKNHANLETKSMHGITALIHAASHGHTEVLQALVEANANLDAVDNYGFTALMLATTNGHTESIDVLIKNNANLETANIDGLTALMLASHGHTEVLQVLIEAHANLEAVDKYGFTPLMLAASNGYTESVKVLLNNGAKLETKSIDGRTALMLAADNGHTEIVEIIDNALKNKKPEAPNVLSAENNPTENIAPYPLEKPKNKPLILSTIQSTEDNSEKNIASETDIEPPEVKKGRKMPQG